MFLSNLKFINDFDASKHLLNINSVSFKKKTDLKFLHANYFCNNIGMVCRLRWAAGLPECRGQRQGTPRDTSGKKDFTDCNQF